VNGGRYVDGTVGGGGHAEALLQASSPTGWLFGCDRDGVALAVVSERLRPFAGRFELRQGNFADLGQWVEAGSCQGVLLDLGVSSPQLDVPERGFSFQRDGPLDMRMDPRGGATAADLINELSEQELAEMFWELAEEPQARRLARAIVTERRNRRFETTGQLARFIERLSPRGGRHKHPATRVFLAMRMAVNNEMNSLRSGLAAACTVLARGGRMAIISFHSVEDRVVKEFGHEESRGYVVPQEVDDPELRQPHPARLKWVQRKAIKPSEQELEDNPRARSAQLRVLERL
jgi:16S rRNA (cytosine1402-N4)-methyltransferase